MKRGLASIEDGRSVSEAKRVREGRPQTMPDLGGKVLSSMVWWLSHHGVDLAITRD